MLTELDISLTEDRIVKVLQYSGRFLSPKMKMFAILFLLTFCSTSINSSSESRPSIFLSIWRNILSVLFSGVDSSSGIFITVPTFIIICNICTIDYNDMSEFPRGIFDVWTWILYVRITGLNYGLARLIYNFCAKYSSSLLHESILHSWHAGSHTHGEYIDWNIVVNHWFCKSYTTQLETCHWAWLW